MGTVTPGQARQNLRICFSEGMLATPWTFISLPGSFIISALLTLHYGIGPGMYGLIASLPAWANALQVVLVPVIGRYMDSRDMALGMSWLNVGLWSMLAALLAYLPEGDSSLAGRIFLVFFLLAAVSASLLGVGWTAWVSDIVPLPLRGKFFGRRNRFISLVTTGFLLCTMLVLELLDESIVAFQLLIGGAILCRFFSVLWQHRIVTGTVSGQGMVLNNWMREVAGLRRNRDFVWMVVFVAVVGFWMNVVGPFAPVFVYEQLGWTPARFAILTILATLGGAAMLPLWGRMIDRQGCVRAIMLSLLLWQTQNYFWVVLTPETAWVLYPMWLWGGLVSAGFLLGTFTLLLKLLPTKAKTAGVSVNLALTSVSAGLAPVLAGRTLDWAAGAGIDTLLCYRIGFFLSPTFILLSLVLLRRVKEPALRSDAPFGLSGATRMFRQILQLQGLAFLANANIFAALRRSDSSKNDETES